MMCNRFWTMMLVLLGLGLAACTASPADEPMVQAEEGGTPAGADRRPTPTLITPTETPQPPTLPDLGLAPDFRNDVWINSEPLRLDDLRGKVVFVEFWTFGCINCQRVIPYINEWYDKYQGEDFEVVGVHYPEFQYEEDVDNVRDAVARFEIEYPVAIDNDRLTWGAYNQRFWPTRYLLDKQGHIRYKHIGEGAYEETEAVIQQLMAEPEP